jgi:hypothetical protein
VSDYIERVGWVEQYIHDLAISLRSIGKVAEIYGYTGNPGRLTRIWLMYMAPFAFWRGISLDKKIQQYQPDLIWMHSVLRYIGPHGVWVVSRFPGHKYITHHDLGLITPRPSDVHSESDILGPSLGDWVPHKGLNIFTILSVTGKWLTISWIWMFLRQGNVLNILPSSWMQPFFQKYTSNQSILFPHTSKKTDSVKQ